MSNSLDTDQARPFLGPDLGPNCLQRLSVEATSRQIIKQNMNSIFYSINILIHHYMGRDMRKFVFRVSDIVRFKPT